MTLLGDRIHQALALVGVTPEWVNSWVGGPCNCEERRQKLNALHLWAGRVLRGKLGGSAETLEALITDPPQ